MVDCVTPNCRQQLPITTIIGTKIRQLTRAVSSECNRNIIYITDDPGLIEKDTNGVIAFDVATTYKIGDVVESGGIVYQSLINNNMGNDPATSAAQWQGTYLTTNNRFQVVGSSTQASDHWKECENGIYSSAYWDLNKFFKLGSGVGKSPGFIVVAYWDRANETLAQALDELYKCFKCFCIVTHPTYLNDGNPFYDTPLHKELEAWAASKDDKVTMNLTLDPVMKTTFTETASQAAQSSALSYKWSHYIWAGEQCIDELDATCAVTGNKINRVSPTHLLYAASVASYSTSATSYIPDPFFRGPGGITDEPIADLSETETINVTGTARAQGGQLADATRYANVYHSVAGRKGFLYGTGVTGYFTYDLMQVKYIKAEMENAIIDFLYRSNNRGISDIGLRALETLLVSLTTKYESQNIITTNEQNFDDQVPAGYVEIQKGAGWILAREQISELTLAELSQGYSPAYFFCYVNLRQLRFINFTLCGLLKPEQVSEVF